MLVTPHTEELREARNARDGSLGFVPTMGFLHEGHLSLVRRAREECKTVAVSIFANPTQFGANEDFASYPRDLQHDLELLEKEKVDIVWTPTAAEMYPPGFQTWVDVKNLTVPLEGTHRPGHFTGVTTVVAKLFNSVQPQRAYFGHKDAQQALVIKKMVRDLNFPIEVIICPTIREEGGLAMSSRNSYLSDDDHEAAKILWLTLKLVKVAFDDGQRNAQLLREIAMRSLASEPRATVQYVAVTDPETLAEINSSTNHALVSMAVVFGKTRLIDNIIVGAPATVSLADSSFKGDSCY